MTELPPGAPDQSDPSDDGSEVPTQTGPSRFLERVLYLSEQIHLNQDLPEVGENICRALGELMGWGRVSFSIRDPDSGGSRVVATHGFSPEERIIALGRAATRVRERAWWEEADWAVGGLFLVPPDQVPGASVEPDWGTGGPPGQEEAAAPFGMLVVPLRTRGRLLGVVVLEEPVSPEAFGPAALEAFRVLSHIAARAIENARILDDERDLVRAAEDHRAFQDSLLVLSQRTLGDIPLSAVGDKVCQVISKQLGWQRVVVTVRDEEMGRARVVACRGFSRAEEFALLNDPGRLDPGVPWYRDTRFRMSRSFFVPAEEYRSLRVQPDLVFFSDHEPHIQANAWQKEDFLIVPLHSGNQQVGAVSVDDPASGLRPTFSQVRDLELVANVAAAAVRNARSFEVARAAQTEWEATFNALDQGMAVLDQDGRITRTNAALGVMMNRPAEELVGLALRALAPGEATLARLEELVTAAEGAFPSVPEEDPALELPMAGRLVRIAAHAVGPRTVIVFTDLTSQRIVQSQMVQAEKMMAVGELMTGIAHGLNDPLTSVVGFSQLLARDGAETADAERMVERILSEAQGASRLVSGLLRFAQRPEGRPSILPPAVFMEDPIQLVAHSARLSGVEVVNRLSADMPPIWVSQGAVEQVVVSLAQNAIRVMEHLGGGVLEISGEVSDDRVLIHVDDTGPGVPVPIRDEIFNPFFTTQADGAGTGLGLAIARSLMEQQGGQLEVGDSPGGGARFTLSLPVATPRPGGGASQEGEEPDSGAEVAAGTAAGPGRSVRPLHISVLLVDEEPHVLELMGGALEEEGCRVTAVTEAEAALQELEQGEFGLIMVDPWMQGMSGLEFHQAVSETHPEMESKILFCTGDGINRETMDFLEGLDRPFLLKPFTIERMREVVRAFLSEDQTEG